MFATPLYDMAARGDADAVRRHLDRGVPVNQRDGDGATALHLATREAHVQFVQLLLVARTDVELTYAETPATAIYLVIMMLNQVVVEAVLERKPALEGMVNGLTPLFIAVSAGNDRIAELLLDAGADAKAITTTSVGTREPVLHMAIASFRNDLVPLLIRHGADVDVAGTNPMGQTTLQIAAQYGNTEGMTHLISSGANLYATFPDGFTASRLQPSKDIYMPCRC